MAETVEIPEPRGLPFIGHIGSLDPDFPLGSMISLADQLGECPIDAIDSFVTRKLLTW
jgi:cytochrome P450/NADPH-cytochrome P450 reductase